MAVPKRKTSKLYLAEQQRQVAENNANELGSAVTKHSDTNETSEEQRGLLNEQSRHITR